MRYDGGYDEGFAHPDYVVINSERVPAQALSKRLAESRLPEQLRESGAERRRIIGHGEPSIQRVMEEAVWELAQELAYKLLGDGFGTGEYSLYGAFKADLIEGRIEDDPDAKMPEGMD